VARVTGAPRRSTDVLRFAPVHARRLRIVITQGSVKPLKPTKTNQNPPPTTPMVEELTATG
jgi:hypothetical protein